MTPEEIREKLLTPAFPIPKLTELLDHDNQQMRQDFRYESLNIKLYLTGQNLMKYVQCIIYFI